MRVRVDALAGAARDGRPLGIRDARIERACRVLATQRELGGLVDVDVPREVEVEISRILRHELGVGETRVFVGSREAADAQRLANRILHARRRKIGRARAAFALVAINGDRETTVALPLDRLELAHAHRHRQTFLVTDADLRLVGTVPARERDGLRGNVLQRFRNYLLIHCRMTSSE